MIPRGKGLDDLFLAGGRPRYRARYLPPPGLGRRRLAMELPEPGPISGGSSLSASRTTTQKGIDSFVRERRKRGDRALVVRSPAGSGKSTAVGQAIAKHSASARVVVGTRNLAQELAATHGFGVVEGRNPQNCERFEVVESLADAGHPVATLACGSLASPKCPARSECPYYAQFGRRGPLIGTSEQLFNADFLRGGDLVVIDDADLLRSTIVRSFVGIEQLTAAMAQVDRRHRGPAHRLIELLAHAVLAARSRLQGSAAWDHLAATAARHDVNIVELVGSLPKDGTLPRPAPKEGRYLRTEDVESVPPGSLLDLFECLRSEVMAFESCEDFNSALRIGNRGVEIGSLRPHANDRDGPIIARLPVLVLDATPVESVLKHVLANHERLPDIDAPIELPQNVHVVQYAARGFGHGSLTDPLARSEVMAQVAQERLRRPAPAPDQEAIVTYKSLRQAMLGEGFLPHQALTFGSVRGTNVLDSVVRLHIVGRPMPASDDVAYIAQILHHDGEAISQELYLRPAEYAGQPYAVDVVDFRDPRLAELLRAHREDELLQTVHRARLLTLSPQQRFDGEDHRPMVRLVLHTNHPVPGLRVDELVLPTVRERQGGDGGRVGNSNDHPTGEAATTPGDEPLGNSNRGATGVAEADPAEAHGVGTSQEGATRRSIWGAENIPHALSREPGVPGHWEPCRGSCGKWMPPGQKCFYCAAEAVRLWKLSGGGRRKAL